MQRPGRVDDRVAGPVGEWQPDRRGIARTDADADADADALTHADAGAQPDCR